MPEQPAEVTQLTDQAIALFEQSQERIIAEQAQILALPQEERDKLFRRSTSAGRGGPGTDRLGAMQQAIDTEMLSLREGMSDWVGTSVPRVYELGGISAALTEGMPGNNPFQWTQIHLDAVNVLAGDMYDDVLQMTDYVSEDTKRWIRDAGKASTAGVIIEGKSPREAARDLRNGLPMVEGDKGLEPINSVTYQDGSKRSLKTYSEMLIRTKTANAFNKGSLTFAVEAGVGVFEIFDGAQCGLTSHDDPQKANGLIVDAKTANENPISHPNCRRAFGARPDLAEEDVGLFDPTATIRQRQDQRAFEASTRSRSRPPRTSAFREGFIEQGLVGIDSLEARLDATERGQKKINEFLKYGDQYKKQAHGFLKEAQIQTLRTKLMVQQVQDTANRGVHLLNRFDQVLDTLGNQGLGIPGVGPPDPLKQERFAKILGMVVSDPADANTVLRLASDMLGFVRQTDEMRGFAKDFLLGVSKVAETEKALLGAARRMNAASRTLIDGAETIVDGTSGMVGKARLLSVKAEELIDASESLLQSIDSLGVREGVEQLIATDNVRAALIDIADYNISKGARLLQAEFVEGLGIPKGVTNYRAYNPKAYIRSELEQARNLKTKLTDVDFVKAAIGTDGEINTGFLNLDPFIDELVKYNEDVVKRFDGLNKTVLEPATEILNELGAGADPMDLLRARLDIRLQTIRETVDTKTAVAAYENIGAIEQAAIGLKGQVRNMNVDQLSEAFKKFSFSNPPEVLTKSFTWANSITKVRPLIQDDVANLVKNAKRAAEALEEFDVALQNLIDTTGPMSREITKIMDAGRTLTRGEDFYNKEIRELIQRRNDLLAGDLSLFPGETGDVATRIAKIEARIKKKRVGTINQEAWRDLYSPKTRQAFKDALDHAKTNRFADTVIDSTGARVPRTARRATTDLADELVEEVDDGVRTFDDVLVQTKPDLIPEDDLLSLIVNEAEKLPSSVTTEVDYVAEAARKARARRTQLRRRVRANPEAMDVIEATGITLDDYIDAIPVTDTLRTEFRKEMDLLTNELRDRMPVTGVRRPKPFVDDYDISGTLRRTRKGELGDYDWLSEELERRLYNGDNTNFATDLATRKKKQINGWFLDEGVNVNSPDQILQAYQSQGYPFESVDEAMEFFVKQADEVDAARAAVNGGRFETFTDVDFNDLLGISPRATDQFELFDANIIALNPREEVVAHIAATRKLELERYLDDPDFLYRSNISPNGAGPRIQDMSLDDYVRDFEATRGELPDIAARVAAGEADEVDEFLLERWQELVPSSVVDVDRLDEFTPEELFYRIRALVDPADEAGFASRQGSTLANLDPGNWQNTLRNKYGDNLDTLYVSKKPSGIVEVDMIRVKNQGQGIGSAVMQDLIDAADTQGVTMALTPEKVGNTSVTKLKEFYKRFGFVENKGRNKDFGTTSAFIREPKGLGSISPSQFIDFLTNDAQLDRLRFQAELRLAQARRVAEEVVSRYLYETDVGRQTLNKIEDLKRQVRKFFTDREAEKARIAQEAIDRDSARRAAFAARREASYNIDPTDLPAQADLPEIRYVTKRLDDASSPKIRGNGADQEATVREVLANVEAKLANESQEIQDLYRQQLLALERLEVVETQYIANNSNGLEQGFYTLTEGQTAPTIRLERNRMPIQANLDLGKALGDAQRQVEIARDAKAAAVGTRAINEADKKFKAAFNEYNKTRNRVLGGKTQLVPATVDEMADTLIHELTHSLDHTSNWQLTKSAKVKIFPDLDAVGPVDEFAGRAFAVGGSGDAQEVGLLSIHDVFKKYAQSETPWISEAFSYGSTMPEESVAEVVKMYFGGVQSNFKTIQAGDPPVNISAKEWREQFPDLAEWVKKVAIGE